MQLGYNEKGQGIIFVAESRAASEQNALFFSEKGMLVKDEMLAKLNWAPILPVREDA